jgi:hypothetical protein
LNEPLNPLQPQPAQDSKDSNDSEGEDDIGDDLEIDDPNVRESLATMLFDTVTRLVSSI